MLEMLENFSMSTKNCIAFRHLNPGMSTWWHSQLTHCPSTKHAHSSEAGPLDVSEGISKTTILDHIDLAGNWLTCCLGCLPRNHKIHPRHPSRSRSWFVSTQDSWWDCDDHSIWALVFNCNRKTAPQIRDMTNLSHQKGYRKLEKKNISRRQWRDDEMSNLVTNFQLIAPAANLIQLEECFFPCSLSCQSTQCCIGHYDVDLQVECLIQEYSWQPLHAFKQLICHSASTSRKSWWMPWAFWSWRLRQKKIGGLACLKSSLVFWNETKWPSKTHNIHSVKHPSVQVSVSNCEGQWTHLNNCMVANMNIQT